MDEEMAEPWRGDFLSLEFEIDLDYEFDASKYFDFSREESYAETYSSELWFDSARSYPPSPFIARLNMGMDLVVENVNTLPKFKDTENAKYVCSDSSIGSGPEFSALNEGFKGWTAVCDTDMVEDVSRDEKKFIKGPFTKGSTLMKPTASQLAKQNRLREVKHRQFLHRFVKSSAQTCKQTVEESSENTGHAAKRQKLEGGRLQKVGVKDQTDLLHEPQKRKQKIMPVDGSSQHSKLRITIPREPELETAQRAQRIRVQRSTNSKQSQEERRPTVPFKARPLNRKILEAPSLPLLQKSTPRLPHFQPFNLKTAERALQHLSGPSSLTVPKDHIMVSAAHVSAPGLRKFLSRPSGSSQLQNHENQAEHDDVHHKFTARPLNMQILTSKGDIGVFRSTKREATKPMEFNFSTDKRCQKDPPTELFNKLSLNTGAHQSSTSQTRSPWPFHGTNKGWKENINYTVRQKKDIHVGREELQRHGIGHEVSQLPGYISHTSKLSNNSSLR